MTLLEYESFSFVFEECVIIHFSISIRSLTHLLYGLSEFFTIRIGIFPIRITDYRYKLIFLHGSTCWLGDSTSPTIQLDELSSLTCLSWSQGRLEERDGYFSPIGSPRLRLMDKSDAASRYWSTVRPMACFWDLHVDNAICASTMTRTTLYWSMIV
jgi:hypothetical protein